jgi:UDP-GlcNAc:undecaprenyl-phosphate/decaprenyl-phosphate GlcNAc-1-phosphate transferase
VCCLVTCGGALASQAFNSELIVLVTIASVVFTLIWTRLFGYAEAMLIKERVLNLLQPAGPARQMEVRLQGSSDWRPLWKLLTEAAERLQLREMLLDVNAPALHESYHCRWDRPAEAEESLVLWRVSIPLSAAGQALGRLEIAWPPDRMPVSQRIEELTQVVDGYMESPPLVSPEAAAAAPAPRTAVAVEAT